MTVLENRVDEQTLVAAAQLDPSRFAELYEMNFARVYAFISRRTATRQDAEDATAEVFHEALRNLGSYEWRGVPFVAWLLGIAVHRLADRWRRTAQQQKQTLVGELDHFGEEQEPTPCVAIDPASVGVRITDSRIEEHVMLYELVDELPDDQRLVIVNRFVHQKSVREIALELNRSEGAIKQLQFRALQTLRIRIRSLPC